MMAGEYQVVKSLFEHSIPRLTGWAPMMDYALEKAMVRAVQYRGGQDSDATY